ncbi:MAG: AmmeMemoRadiSam system radical SAM enzyme [archaeon]
MPERVAELYEKLADNFVKCKICAHCCVIAPGARGICRTRENRAGTLYSLIYGELTASAVDPIEKKPLFHFWPGSFSYSISSVGCNFRCPWCQNYGISQAEPGDVYTEPMDPQRVVEQAMTYGCRSISYTYNEPLIWHEYVRDTARLAKEKGILNVLVTNGYATNDAMNALAPYIDAANVDVKGFTEHFYKEYCRANLNCVLDATADMKKRGIHVETTLLIIPTLNDDPALIREMARWHLKELGPEVPLHFSRFHPCYKLTEIPATPTSTTALAREIALKEGIRYVYVGNVSGDTGENTYCPSCRSLVIERIGYHIGQWNLDQDNKCLQCGSQVDVVGEREKPSSSVLRRMMSI